MRLKKLSLTNSRKVQFYQKYIPVLLIFSTGAIFVIYYKFTIKRIAISLDASEIA
jgi:hypothetical protein